MAKNGKFLIVTGLSGAGKSLVARCFEDLNFFCVDNMPPALLSKFAQLCHTSEVSSVALVCDIRGLPFFGELTGALQELPRYGYEYEILFLEATDEVLVRRFSETRRKHPLADGARILEGIQEERRLLADIRALAHRVIDTSELSAKELKDSIVQHYSSQADGRAMSISVVTFGYKYGIPLDADLVFDVRFLPNPFYVADFRHRTGTHGEVREFVLKFGETQVFLNKLYDMVNFLIPYYIKEGKTHLTIGVGCTGGHHRSVTIGGELARFLESKKYSVIVEHRDITKKETS